MRIRHIDNPSVLLWWMFGGTGVTQTTQFMVMPFIALYMSSETGAAPGMVGLAVGMMPLTTTVFSFIGGSLADKFGRKPLMVMAMLISAIAMVGFGLAHTTTGFFVVSILTGLSRALFGPASQAMMTDISLPEQRGRVFGINYWVNNIGASVGPILGAYFGSSGGGGAFYAAAAVSLLYTFVIAIHFPESNAMHRERVERPSIYESLRTLKVDKVLTIFIVAGVFTNIGYSQFDTTLPQLMKSMLGTQAAAHDYAYIFAITGFEVVLLQFILNRFADRLGFAWPLVLSQLLYALAFVGFGVSHRWTDFLMWAVVLTIGEMIAAPRMVQYVSMIASENMFGSYFGAYSLSNLGYSIGPAIGGVFLRHFGGLYLFLVMSVVALAAGPMYLWSYRGYAERKSGGVR